MTLRLVKTCLCPEYAVNVIPVRVAVRVIIAMQQRVTEDQRVSYLLLIQGKYNALVVESNSLPVKSSTLLFSPISIALKIPFNALKSAVNELV